MNRFCLEGESTCELLVSKWPKFGSTCEYAPTAESDVAHTEIWAVQRSRTPFRDIWGMRPLSDV